jgi:quinol monooxygenase YgiN
VVLQFLREAVNDTDVMVIKQTIYRTGSSSELMDLLRQAVARGKEVTVVLELKARFDEETNINWADKMESIGVQVLYGVVGLKTHAKMMLVTRKEGASYKRYAHLSTGNYNPTTARFYTDFSYLTANSSLTADVEHVFTHLAGQSRLARLNQLWVAPFYLHRRLVEKIESLGERAAAELAPAQDWQAPELAIPIEPEQGSVMVTIESRVLVSTVDAFVALMSESRRHRLRNGALSWELFRDSADPERFVEWYLDESWVAHLRQHERLTQADLELRAKKHALHEGDSLPRVLRLVAQPLHRDQKGAL